MFKKKEKIIRYPVQINIDFNLTNINIWLRNGGIFEDIDHQKEKKEDIINQSYIIEQIPIDTTYLYFHKEKNIITDVFSGEDSNKWYSPQGKPWTLFFGASPEELNLAFSSAVANAKVD